MDKTYVQSCMRSGTLSITCRISWTRISSVLNAYVAPNLFLEASSVIPVYNAFYRPVNHLVSIFKSSDFILAISLFSYVASKNY